MSDLSGKDEYLYGNYIRNKRRFPWEYVLICILGIVIGSIIIGYLGSLIWQN